MYVWIVILIIAVVVAVCIHIIDFLHELKYINIEIEMADDEEREYWLLCRRRLWLSLFIFVYKYFIYK